MHFWTIHIVTLAILFTGTMAVSQVHFHWQHADGSSACLVSDQAPAGHEKHDAHDDGHAERHGCCGVHSHQLVAFDAQMSENISPRSLRLPHMQSHAALPVISRDIFHPPISA